MGVPFVTAETEAESQCAHMAKQGIVYAVATEDMDALTFGSSILLRNLLSSASKLIFFYLFINYRNLPIVEFNLEKVLTSLEIDMVTVNKFKCLKIFLKFTDLCILMGCDYCPTIKGIGPNKGIELLKKYGSIENIIKSTQYKSKDDSDNDYDYDAIRKLFLEPKVADFSQQTVLYNLF